MWKVSFILYVCCLYGFLPGLCGAVNKVGVNKSGDSPVASSWALVDETLQSYAQKHTFPGQFGEWRPSEFGLTAVFFVDVGYVAGVANKSGELVFTSWFPPSHQLIQPLVY